MAEQGSPNRLDQETERGDLLIAKYGSLIYGGSGFELVDAEGARCPELETNWKDPQ